MSGQADGTIYFKDWLPDQPDLNNIGLTEAKNVLPVDGSYRSFSALTAYSTTAPSRPVGALYPSGANGSTFFDSIYAGLQTALYVYTAATGWTNKSSATYGSTTDWDFVQFDELVIATNGVDVPQRHTLGSAAAFTALAVSTTAPIAKAVGVINRFVMLGNLEAAAGLTREHSVQWSGIDAPTNWPTPLSTTAVSVQSGLQDLYQELGPVRGIYGGDQHGIIVQAGGLTRATYIGGNVVFQFDTISKTHGAAFPNASININGILYFVSIRGFCATDGVNVIPIGDQKIDRYFLNNVSFPDAVRMTAAHDANKKLILWNVPTLTSSAGQPNLMLVYNYEEKRWTRTDQVSEVLFTPPAALPLLGPYGFTSIYQASTFTGTHGTAILTTGEIEPSPGAFARVNGIKPLIDQSALTVAMGTRNDRTSAVTYTGETSVNSRSGFADFRSEARYQRARITIAGTFNAAQGLEFMAVPSGGT
jgi:hypothetical protein